MRNPDVAVPRRVRARAIGVVVAVLAGLLTVVAAPMAGPAGAASFIDRNVAPSGESCLGNVLHSTTSFPGCNGVDLVHEIRVGGSDVAQSTQLAVGDEIKVSVFASQLENQIRPFYTETGDGLINTEDWEARFRITVPAQPGVLSAPTITASNTDRGPRGVGVAGQCATQSDTEPARTDSRNVDLGAAPVGPTGLRADRSGDAVTVRWTDLAVDRCAESVSQNGIYTGLGFSVTQTVLARPTSDETLTWTTSGLILGYKDLPGRDSLTWGAGRGLSMSIKGLPTAPTAVTATPRNGAAQVSWTAPSTDGGSPLAGYVVTPYIGSTAQTPQTFNGGATTRTVTGLTNQTTYTFRVAAFTNVGTGAQSAPSNAVTPSAAPGAPTGVTARPGNGSATVSWTNPTNTGGSPLTRTRVSSYRNGTFAGEQNPPAGSTSLTLTGLTNGASYTFTVAVGNAVAFGPASAPSAAVVPGPQPAPPSDIRVTSGRPGRLQVAWTPGDDGGSPITGSITKAYDLDGNLVATEEGSGPEPAANFFDLANGTAYQVTVALSNARGFGFPSALTAPVTVGVGPAAPAVTGTSAAFSPNTVFVSWTDPTNTGTNPITGGRIRAYAGGVEVANQPYDGDLTNGQITGLTAGTAYTFTVQVCNVVACSPESSASTPTTAIGRPSAPTIVGTERTANGVDVSWTPGRDDGGRPVTGYRITPYVDGVADIPTSTSDPGTASVDFLTLGTTYTFTVAADNGFFYGAESPMSEPVVAGLPRLPGAPTLGTTTGNADGTVTVRWSPPADDGTATIRTYVVTPYVGGIAQPIEYALGTETARTFPVLSGLAYRFTVAAGNAAGLGPESTLSDPVTATRPAGAPAAPTAVTATRGNGSVGLTWNAPAAGSTPISGYRVTPFRDGVAQPATSVAGASPGASVSGLVDGGNYRFRVEAVNSRGAGTVSAASNAVTAASAPGAPTVSRVTVGVHAVTLAWSAPASTGGSPVTGYRVTLFVAGVAQRTLDVAGPARSRIVDDLDAGVAYTFAVSAVNAVGVGAASTASRAVTPTAPPGTPSAPTIGSATAGDGAVTVSWAAPATAGSGPVTGYRLAVYAAGVRSGTTTVDAATTTFRIPGLTNGVAYSVRVAALNGSGVGRASAASAVVTPGPTQAPPTVTSVSAGNGAVTVKWAAAAPVPGASAVSGYRVTPYVGAVAQPPVTFAGLLTTRTVAGLANGTTYRFTVAAVNDSGPGADSAVSGPATPAAPPGTASPPAIGTAEAFNTTAVVRWSTPASDGGSAVTGYQVTPFVAGIAGAPVTFASTSTVQVMTGLTNGTTYVFRVAAVNANGAGSPSAGSNPVTPNPAPGTPSAPTIESATPTSGGVTLTWNPPANDGGSTITGYRVTPYIGTVAQPAFQYSDTLTTHTVAPLTSGTTYTFRVAAVNANGPGADSAKSAAVTPNP